MWVAVPGCDPSPTCSTTTPPGKIEEYNPAASSWVATYQLPSGYTQPLFLAFDAQGNLWFAMPMANSIGMLNLVSKTFQQIPVPTADAGPWDIAIDFNGNIWFTEHYSNKIGELNPSTQAITEISTPASNSQPYGIVVDTSNDIWFTENNSSVALIGEYTSGGKLNEYKIRNSSSSSLTPHLITVDPNGNIWWTEGWAGKIGELTLHKRCQEQIMELANMPILIPAKLVAHIRLVSGLMGMGRSGLMTPSKAFLALSQILVQAHLTFTLLQQHKIRILMMD